MKPVTRRRTLLTGLFAAILLVPELLLLPDVLDSRPICDRTADWVRLHANSLPVTLTELNGYPDTYRRVAFAGMSPVQKSNVVTEHLQSVAKRHSDLRTRELVSEALAIATPDLYAMDAATRRGITKAFEVRALASGIDRAIYRDIFTRLGEEHVVRRRDLQATRVTIVEWARGYFIASAALPPAFETCECSTDADWCTGGKECWYSLPGFGCSHSSWGCGTLFVDPCNGSCQTPWPGGVNN